MQTPASSQPPSAILTDLRNGLLKLHKILLDSERAIYERDIERIKTPGQFLGLVMDDPWFAYLRQLSKLVVEIDERLDGEEVVLMAESSRYLDRARALISPSENGQGFERRYFEALQRDPDVVLAHAATTRLIAGLRAA
ncbi:MAG: hypothetical protein H7Y20_06680 [Bryobacteraceae bacterium]|nr:hypothetical protein [Bryobacteraceae bacterium]